jgi:hypothetical protein
MKICIIGNCQADGFRACVAAMLPNAEVLRVNSKHNLEHVADSDVVFLQTTAYDYEDIFRRGRINPQARVMPWPTFYFPAFHPDLIIDDRFSSPLGVYHSSIAIKAFSVGLDVPNTVSLYRGEVFERLGYFDYIGPSLSATRADLELCGLDASEILKSWIASGVFAHTVNHPTMFVLRTVATGLLEKLGVDIDVHFPELFLEDPLAWGKWPIHREIADRLVVPHSEIFASEAGSLTLGEFIEGSFVLYEKASLSEISAPERIASNREAYDSIPSLAFTLRSHPYANLPSAAFWRKSVEQCNPTEVDPVVAPKIAFKKDDRIATGGSCFAQHIARVLIQEDRSFLMMEPAPPELSGEEAARRGYNLFSARYGNIYTARQLLQLVRRCTGAFAPVDVAWRRPDGRFVDPFRPQLEPEGYSTANETLAAAREHLDVVRKLFETADIFIFTVGLTETWASKIDGAVFPVAPGVVAGEFDPDRYVFVNMTVDQVARDLLEAIRALRNLNPSIRILLTVSPVPLVATYSGEHVIRATTYSKSVLRAAVEQVCSEFDYVDYFPSYEIICGAGSDGRYFDADRRSVTSDGVAHVMRVLRKHYFNQREFAYECIDDFTSKPSRLPLFNWQGNGLRRREIRLFDRDWYLRSNPDVAAANCDPLAHYQRHGRREGRRPNPIFDPNFYVWQCANDSRARKNPLLHYLTVGHRKGLRPNRLFDLKTFSEIAPKSGELTALEQYLEFNSKSALSYSDGQKMEQWLQTQTTCGPAPLSAEIRAASNLLCDEEALDNSIP